MNEGYALEQIKKAFWEAFHKTGEIWFDYLGTEEENNSSTNEKWLDFQEALFNSPVPNKLATDKR